MSSENHKATPIERLFNVSEFYPAGSRIISAVSGGADSVALLWLLKNSNNFEVIAAHAEHGIRGKASTDDAEFVVSLCRKLGIECVVEHLNVLERTERGESTEMGARRLRYEFLERICTERMGAGVALGHNRDDVAETFLLNLFRGSGVRGLSGIPVRRGVFFRPLLRFSHAELCNLLRSQGIEWREDATNLENDYLRNRIRNIFIPQIKNDINPRAVEHIADAAADIAAFREREEAEGVDVLLRIRDELSRESQVPQYISLKKIRSLEEWEISALIREVGMRYNVKTLSRERTKELIGLLKCSGRFIFQWQKNFTLYALNGQLEFKMV